MVPFVFARLVACVDETRYPRFHRIANRFFGRLIIRRGPITKRTEGVASTLRTTAPVVDRQPHAAVAAWLQSQPAQ